MRGLFWAGLVGLGGMSLANDAATRPGNPGAACPIERTIYRLKGAPQFIMGFVKQRNQFYVSTDLSLYLKTPKRTFWFSFNSPNGHVGDVILPNVDPTKATGSRSIADNQKDEPKFLSQEGPGILFDAFTRDLTKFGWPPSSRDKAPAYLYARGLTPALWYSPLELANGDGRAEQESMPMAMFEAAGCRPVKR